jgi:two-component system chemotaxis sensor kinase CheA
MKEFVAESQEGLERMELCLTDLEQRPDDGELVSEIFRTVHTIKGTTSFLGFTRLQTLAHAGESLLGALRDGKIVVTADLISGLLRLMDALRRIVGLIEATGQEGEQPAPDDTALIEVLTWLKTGVDEPGANATGACTEVQTTPQDADINSALSSPVQNRTLRIDVEAMDHMMNLVGELILTRNQILQCNPGAQGFPDLARRLDTVTADLRESVRQARMQPLGHLFAKFPRMVRDLALTCGRRVRIEFKGQQTGLDKTLLEAIRDPLTHAVRNSVDHGIESPEQRLMAGKPIEGVIRLHAFQQSGSVVIEVTDDGAGIPAAAVLQKAVERKLVTPEQAAAMGEREALQLIFAPGISLSPAITHVSGRGVGMDVVRTNVQKVGGSVEVDSTLGSGTTLRLRVPLTLAIVPALVVRSGGQSFALPQHSLIELVHLASHASDAAIERIGSTEIFRLRDSLLPLVRLDRLLQIELTPSPQKTGSYIAVMEEGRRRFGVLIDALSPPEEIVVKPLSSVLRDIGMYSGATVLGNGELALILDVKAIADRAGHRASSQALTPSGEELPTHSSDTGVEPPATMVIYEIATHSANHQAICARMAIPLNFVERIERIPLGKVEYIENNPVMQYRGDLISLEDQGDILMEIKHRSTLEDPCDLRVTSPSGLVPGWSESSEVLITVMICVRPAAPASKRFGIVVQRVLNVSAGTLLTEDAELGTSPLAMFEDRVATVRVPPAVQVENREAVALQEVA